MRHGRSKDSPLPPGIFNKDVAIRFNNYFIEKTYLQCLTPLTMTVTGVVLKWLKSYLKDRTQTVEIGVPLSGGSRSEFVSLRSGIPGGSVLGPILFTIYTVPIGNICRRHQVEFHLYADDIQIYLSFRPSIPFSKHDCIARIKKCIEEMGIWMIQSLLKLNSDKMEFILFGT